MKAEKVQSEAMGYGYFPPCRTSALAIGKQSLKRIHVTSSSSGGLEQWAAETKQNDSFSAHKKMNFSAPSSSKVQMQQFFRQMNGSSTE
jgi:hypothetical protein